MTLPLRLVKITYATPTSSTSLAQSQGSPGCQLLPPVVLWPDATAIWLGGEAMGGSGRASDPCSGLRWAHS
jgi:hypothetical protein